ncbi:S8 family serine peptidase [Nonomuraea dietziae]|uniref:S8 family serine peptidase n=1 Tax=Nonomuraea dietziae TaxID=65515 RepID=UPI00342B6305
MRRLIYGLTAAALVTPLVVGASVVTAPSAVPTAEIMVFYADGGQRAAIAAIEAGGGRAVSTEPKLGYVLAKGTDPAFVNALGRSEAVVGISTDRAIGFASAALGARGRIPSAGPVGGAATGSLGLEGRTASAGSAELAEHSASRGRTEKGARGASSSPLAHADARQAPTGDPRLPVAAGQGSAPAGDPGLSADGGPGSAAGDLGLSTVGGPGSAAGDLGLSAAGGPGSAAVDRRGDSAGQVGQARQLVQAGGGAQLAGVVADGQLPDGSAVRGSAAEPLAARQWDMRMIGADRANRIAPGTKKVLVGIIDTGVDGKHPDIAPNFNRELSRNFVTDRPNDPKGQPFDGPCEYKGCKDPVDVDDDGHGTHVASTIGSPVNGKGIAGVAPNVQLVNLRAGHDSGFFFLKPSLDALTYAADNGIDVVNMSFYIDPWAFNCTSNPADSQREQLEQRGIITGMQRALDYARSKGVTLISALGNGSIDLGNPRTDIQSPNYPKESSRTRKIDNSCLNVPAESKGVISVSALGPSGRKAVYSDYGIEQTDLAAPGGDALDGTSASPLRSILAAAPKGAMLRDGKIDQNGMPKTASVVRDCHGSECAYYQYLDGTSMAAPHATGVAAILISRFGRPGEGGVAMDPAEAERLLYASATPKACPTPRAYVYDYFGQKETHTCEGDEDKNGFYGRGVVDAYRAATLSP